MKTPGAPLLATKATTGALHELAEVEHVARGLGTPLMPWQRQFIRVATEYRPDEVGRRIYRYPTVVLTVPRQSGKTTVVRALLTTRALLKPRRKAFLTAQSGKDARERFFELVEQIQRSPLASVVSVRAAADSTRITFTNGARIAPFVPHPEALHGSNFEDLLLDEIFAFNEDEGEGILGGAVPAMQTHRDRQTIMISTKGNAKSVFLNKMLDAGRAAVTDPNTTLCFLEWALPDGDDPYDPACWDFHPALGHTITKDDIAAATSIMTKGEFTRAFMNRTTEVAETVIDMTAWNAGQHPLTPPEKSAIALGFDISAQSRAAIVAAWHTNHRDQEDHGIQLATVRAGWSPEAWLAETLHALGEAGFLAIGADASALNRVILDQAAADPTSPKLTPIRGADAATAATAFKTGVETGAITGSGDPGLTHAIATAVTRNVGEAWAFSQKSEPELRAAVTAVRLLSTEKSELQPQIFVLEA